HHGVIHDQIPAGHSKQEAQSQVEEYVPRPRPLEHTSQAIVGDAVKRVSYSRTGRHVGKIQQRHEVYPQWLRHRFSPSKREAMLVFMLTSSDAYLLSWEPWGWGASLAPSALRRWAGSPIGAV